MTEAPKTLVRLGRVAALAFVGCAFAAGPAQAQVQAFTGERPTVGGVEARLYAACYDRGCSYGFPHGDINSEDFVVGTPIVGALDAEGDLHPCVDDPAGGPFCVSVRARGPIEVDAHGYMITDSGVSHAFPNVGQPPLEWLGGETLNDSLGGLPDWWFSRPESWSPAYVMFNLYDPEDALRYWAFVVRFAGIVPAVPESVTGPPPTAQGRSASAVVSRAAGRQHKVAWAQEWRAHVYAAAFRNGNRIAKFDLGIKGHGYRTWTWKHGALRAGTYRVRICGEGSGQRACRYVRTIRRS